MRYFELFDDVNIRGRWHLGEILAQDGGSPRLLAGVPVEGPFRTTVTHGRQALDFCLTSFAVPVARRTLAVVMQRLAGPDLQRVPLLVARRADEHEVLNCTRVVDCIDQERSATADWAPEDGQDDLLGTYRSVDALTVDPRRIPPDAHFFRTARWLVGLVVSERMMAVMQESGARGASFIPVT